MSRSLVELQAIAEKRNTLACRIVRLWPNDLPTNEVDKHGFYWCVLDKTRMRPLKENRVYLGKTLSEAKSTLLKVKLPKGIQHATA